MCSKMNRVSPRRPGDTSVPIAAERATISGARCGMRLGSRTPGCLGVISIVLLVSQMLACGSFSVAGAFLPSDVSVVTGTVSFVSFSVVSNANGEFYNVTVVTLLAPLGTNTVTLCGDQRLNFVMGTAVRLSYTAAQGCSNLVKVTAL